AELRVVAVGDGRCVELLAVGLVEGAPPVAFALEQVLQHVERALLPTRPGLAVREEMAVLVAVVAAGAVEEARVLDARQLRADATRGGVVAVLAREQEGDRQR